MNIVSADAIQKKALELGFNIVGIIPAEPAHTLQAYFRWVEAEMHGKMGYMARPDRQIRRQNLNYILNGVKSMILVGVDYRVFVPETLLTDPSRGRIASYAWGYDYHDWLTPRLEALATWFNEQHSMKYRVYVDTGAILERAHAQQAGLGFIGKNTMLIHPQRGSYFFIGEILTDYEFEAYSLPHRATMCGTCTRCLTACPTDAFPEPYVLDARKCISYLTIEHKGDIDPQLRPKMGNWIYGCDVCQDVCPWNRFVIPTEQPYFRPADANRIAPLLEDVLMLNEVRFQHHFAKTPIERIGYTRLIRNACIAAGNWGDKSILPALHYAHQHGDDLIRTHADWAIAKI
ncbi:MAG: tRNA epoxyqueuosine(34) reductase QueG [Anaerolineae bacterium]|jgi:epoxyqueuosine reductase|nr:tRNA epoxyqueuosine(34) reductase QueG [Anaerolineae bacterium]